jgi:hypothetical protein
MPAYLDDPEFNIRYAAQQLGAAERRSGLTWGEGTEKYDHPYDPATGTGYFGALGHNPYPGDGGDYSQVGNTWDPTQQLPFGEKEYLEKYVRYQTLLDQYNRSQSTVDPLTDAPQAFDPNLLNEMFTLEYELSEYDRIKSEGGTGLDDELARLDYWNKNNPALIDAQNSANEWARQQTLNDMAQSGTKTALQEQRLTQDSANAETAAYKGSSVFTAPMGFRVGSTDLPTEDEVFAKQMEMASSKLPEVKPIPYAAPYPVQQQPRAPTAPSTGTGTASSGGTGGILDRFKLGLDRATGKGVERPEPPGSVFRSAITNPVSAVRDALARGVPSNYAPEMDYGMGFAPPSFSQYGSSPTDTYGRQGSGGVPTMNLPPPVAYNESPAQRRYRGSIFGGR